MRRFPLIAMSVLALSACGKNGDEQPAANAAAEAKPPMMQPGEWEITRKVTGYAYDGLTAEEYQAKLGETATTKACITPETADRPDAAFLAVNQGADCSYSNLYPSDGRLSATINCKANGGTLSLLLDGSTYDSKLRLAEQGTWTAQGKPTVRTSADVSATRLGDCPVTAKPTS